MGELRSQTWNGDSAQTSARTVDSYQPGAAGAKEGGDVIPSQQPWSPGGSFHHSKAVQGQGRPMERTHCCKDAAHGGCLAPFLLLPHKNPPWLPLAELNWRPTDSGAWKTQCSGVQHFAVPEGTGEAWGRDQGVNVQITTIILCTLSHMCSSQSMLPEGNPSKSTGIPLTCSFYGC